MTIVYTKPKSNSPERLLCSTCKELKPHDQFRPNPRNPSGLSYKCRQCTAAYSAAYARKCGAKTTDSERVLSLRVAGSRFGLTDDQQAMFADYHQRTGMSITSTIRMALDEFFAAHTGSNSSKFEAELVAYQQKAEAEAA